ELSIVDVGEQDVPTDNLSARIAKGKPTDLEPAVDAVKAPDARLEIVGIACTDRLCEALDDARQILRMDRSVRTPFPHLLQRLAAVIDELLVDDGDLTRRRQGRDQTWNGVHDQARLAFAFAHGYFRSSPLHDLLLQELVGRGKFTRSPGDAFVEFAG